MRLRERPRNQKCPSEILLGNLGKIDVPHIHGYLHWLSDRLQGAKVCRDGRSHYHKTRRRRDNIRHLSTLHRKVRLTVDSLRGPCNEYAYGRGNAGEFFADIYQLKNQAYRIATFYGPWDLDTYVWDKTLPPLAPKLFHCQGRYPLHIPMSVRGFPSGRSTRKGPKVLKSKRKRTSASPFR